MLGGGYFTAQNKVLPGSYINFVSAASAGTTVAERGTVAIGIESHWGKSGLTVLTPDDLLTKSQPILGYNYSDSELQVIREVMKHASKVLLYRLNGNGVKATNAWATSKYAGTRGNDLSVSIVENVDNSGKYDVTLYLGTKVLAKQVALIKTSELLPNDYVDWPSEDKNLQSVGNVALTGGTDSEVTGSDHVAFLNALESESYNILATTSTDAEIKSLYVAYTKRMIEDTGVKIQCVLYNTAADHEGIINVTTAANLVPWVAGAEAGCELSKSITNMTYDGELDMSSVNYTQAQLEDAIKQGELVFHKVAGDYKVLKDINSLVTLTPEKGGDFKNNQTIRIIDQIGNDVATIFNGQFLGKVSNDAAGRVSFWSALVDYFKKLVQMRAIVDFAPNTDVVVEAGDDNTSVVVRTQVDIINCMETLYMTVYVL